MPILRAAGIGVALLALAVFAAWLTSPNPAFNPATFEDEPLTLELADQDVALTLAQFEDAGGETVTLLVEAFTEETVTGINLADLGASSSPDPFAVLASLEPGQLSDAFDPSRTRTTIATGKLLPAAPPGDRHIGIGTNFPEHAEESGSDDVFNFPKFGTATPARTSVPAPADGLLDYEVELCMRFDRPIASLADFDAAAKGLFLCADFTDRIALVNLADPDNLDSGFGFSDAKSGEGFFPSGPFLVIPKDWQSFVAETRMTTSLNGEPRQDARGQEMILDFRLLTEKVLADMDQKRFFYQGDFFRLAPKGRIEQDMVLMSGTSEGVIFTPPTRRDYIDALVTYTGKGGPLSGQSVEEVGKAVFVKNKRAGGHFLKPGDTVHYQATALGDIVVEVVE